jgi:hypothetical protein
MNTETVRTISIEIYKRNIRARIALLILRGINRGLRPDERQELKNLQARLDQAEKQS